MLKRALSASTGNDALSLSRSGLVLGFFMALMLMPIEARQRTATVVHQSPGASPTPVAASRLDEVIEEDISMLVPLLPRCGAAGFAVRVVRAIQMPAGIEVAPGVCDGSQKRPPGGERLTMTLTGLTAREAFDELVKLDPLYHWVETEGVVVMRPWTAWADTSNFLHRTSSSFDVEALNYADALRVVRSGLGLGPYHPNGEGRTPQGRQAISVHLQSPTSAYEALNSIVRAHGALVWMVSYCGGGKSARSSRRCRCSPSMGQA